jgi:hypothetical protein
MCILYLKRISKHKTESKDRDGGQVLKYHFFIKGLRIFEI